MTQPELAFQKVRARRGPAIVAGVLEELELNGGWMTRAQLATAFSAREIRLAGQYGDGRILACDLGVKAMSKATKEDYERACAWHCSQIKAMQAKVQAYHRRWHQKVGQAILDYSVGKTA